MPMNLVHRRLCSSARWGRRVEESILPWTLEGLELGDDVLEIGPGFAATTRVLARRPGRLTAVEIDADSANHLAEELGSRLQVVHADATAMPLPDSTFSAAVCFTMLHHVPSPALQDRLFAEAVRVIRPGGVFAGSDSQPSLRMRVIHVGDTLVPVPPDTLAARLQAAGLVDIQVDGRPGRVRFRGVRPIA